MSSTTPDTDNISADELNKFTAEAKAADAIDMSKGDFCSLLFFVVV